MLDKFEVMADLDQTSTSLQFVLTSLALAFEMKPKQAASLLTDNHKYLMHICIKGMKGGDFSRVQQWYYLTSQHTTRLA